MGAGAAAALQIVLALLDKAALIGGLIGKAQGEGRDLTQAELDQIVAADDTAKQQLDAAIAAAKAQGR